MIGAASIKYQELLKHSAPHGGFIASDSARCGHFHVGFHSCNDHDGIQLPVFVSISIYGAIVSLYMLENWNLLKSIDASTEREAKENLTINSLTGYIKKAPKVRVRYYPSKELLWHGSMYVNAGQCRSM